MIEHHNMPSNLSQTSEIYFVTRELFLIVFSEFDEAIKGNDNCNLLANVMAEICVCKRDIHTSKVNFTITFKLLKMM